MGEVNQVIAEVIVDIIHSDVDRVFDYKIPATAVVELGVEVLIPFQRRQITGFVVGIKPQSTVADHRLRYLIRVLHDGEVLLQPDLIALASQMANYYIAPLAQALDTIVPGGLRGLRRQVQIKHQKWVQLTALGRQQPWPIVKRAHRQLAVLELLAAKGRMKLTEVQRIVGNITSTTLQALSKKGLITIESQEVLRRPTTHDHQDKPNHLILNSAQQLAVDRITGLLNERTAANVLLHGVTGSGKTEVYISSIEYALSQKRDAIMLVPEITLTSQTISRLTARFGNTIAVLHSSLSAGERYDEWRRVVKGEVRVVVGARSAIFAPLAKIGIIIIDEEHESTFKQQDNLRYDARLIARWRAQAHQAIVVSGSATPSVTSYYEAIQGEALLLTLPKRITPHPLPPVKIVDMRLELKNNNYSLLSLSLQRALHHHIVEHRGKGIILLNRRGYANLVICRDCGHATKCPQCEVTLTYHASDNTLKCHYCDTVLPLEYRCPNCNGSNYRPVGSGTQKIEQLLQELLPAIPIIRMDSDSTKLKNAHFHLLKRFKDAERGILLGTQMIAKGLDIPEVVLVGVINADITLNLPDYRADERTFQLLTQVAGRSGRGIDPGEVIIQTYTPSHPSILDACHHDYQSFYQREILYRQRVGYPPFMSLIRIVCSHSEERIARRGVQFIAHQLADHQEVIQLNPSPAAITKIKHLYRWHLVLKYNGERSVLRLIKNIVMDLRQRSNTLEKPLRISIDVDPEDMF